jgi:hypothetical protein
MATYTVPFVDETIDTSDPSGSAMNFAEGVAAVATLVGMGAAANYLLNRFSEVSGASAPEVPGV